MARPRVAVIGAGPAGLSAAAHLVRLLGDRVEVELLHQGHHLGGKAASWKDGEGHHVEHGFHVCFGFYRAMFELLALAGVRREDVLRTTGHRYAYVDDATGRIATFERAANPLSYAFGLARSELLPFWDQLNVGRFFAFVSALVADPANDLAAYDDRCFTAFALEHGVKERATYSAVFRFFRQAYFNWPEEISAYHVLRTHQAMLSREGSELFNFTRPLSESVWGPVGRWLESRGVKVTFASRWTGFAARLGPDAGRVERLLLTTPDTRLHEHDRTWHDVVLEDRATDREAAFDAVISAVPFEELRALRVNGGARLGELEAFRGLAELRSGTTMNLVVETATPIRATPLQTTAGLRGPLHVVTDVKPFFDTYRDDPATGSALVLVGQPGEYASWDDDAIVQATLAQVARLEGVRPVQQWGIRRVELHRNESRPERLFLGEPGVQRFRPPPQLTFDNLFLAGDFVQNGLDIVCMEAAIRSGRTAAELVARRFA